MRGAGDLLADHAVQLLQFQHEVVLGVQAAGGVDKEVIGLARVGGGDGVVGHGGGVGAVISGDDFNFEAGAPESQLFNGGGAKGVAGGENGGLAPGLNGVGELGAGGGLAGAVDADDGDDGGAGGDFLQVGVLGRKALFNFRAGDGEIVQPAGALGFVGEFYGRHDLIGHGDAEIGADEGLLDFLEGFGGKLGRARNDALDFVDELGLRFGEAGFEFGE